ncbi:MAG: DUF2341 domain-containing protein [bacterium]
MKFWISSISSTSSTTNWSYYRDIVITNQSGTLTEYQVKIQIPYNSNMQTDFDDVRITDTSNVLLGQWRETYTSGTETRFVKVPTIPPSGSTTVRMHYGNSNASSVSSVTNTFIREISGLKGAWQLDEGTGTIANDTSGNGYNGTLTNGASFITSGGKFGNAVQVDGTDDVVDIANFPFPSSFSFVTWAKPYATSSSQRALMRIDTNGAPSIYHEQTNYWKVYSTANGFLSSGVSIVENTLYHLAFTFDETRKIYVDGVFKASDTTTYGAGTNTLKIGGDAYSQMFYGNVSNALMFNSVLLDAEISDLYNNYGYSTTNYPGKVLVKKYASPEPTYTIGSVEYTSTYSE